MTIREHDLPETRQPERSRVGPVRKDVRDSSSEIVDLLIAGLGPKVASEALAKAAARANVSAERQVALNRRLLGAPAPPKEPEPVRDELAERLAQTEKDLQERSQTFSRQAADAEEQIFSLRKELAAARSIQEADGNGHGWGARLSWWVVGLILTAIIGSTIFLHRAGFLATSAGLNTDPANSASSVLIRYRERGSPDSALQGKAGPSGALGEPAAGPTEEQALDRLDRVLSRVPRTEVDRVLHAANLWLKASGTPPCTTQWATGETSLLVTVSGKSNEPLVAALTRCADAVEHVSQ